MVQNRLQSCTFFLRTRVNQKSYRQEKKLLQVCSTDGDESKSIIVDESSTEVSEPECVHKNINKEKDANIEAGYKEPTVMDDPIVVKEPIYINIFECGKNILNRIYATCEQECMATPRYK